MLTGGRKHRVRWVMYPHQGNKMFRQKKLQINQNLCTMPRIGPDSMIRNTTAPEHTLSGMKHRKTKCPVQMAFVSRSSLRERSWTSVKCEWSGVKQKTGKKWSKNWGSLTLYVATPFPTSVTGKRPSWHLPHILLTYPSAIRVEKRNEGLLRR